MSKSHAGASLTENHVVLLLLSVSTSDVNIISWDRLSFTIAPVDVDSILVCLLYCLQYLLEATNQGERGLQMGALRLLQSVVCTSTGKCTF